MNFLLQFKQKSHSEAYSHDYQLQIRKKMLLVWIWALASLTGNVVTFIVYKEITMTSFNFSKLLLLFISGILLCFMRCYVRRIKRFIHIINFMYDIMLVVFQFVLYPAYQRASIEAFGKLAVYVIAWTACLGTFSIYYALANWWLKLLVPIIQVIYLMVFVMQEQVAANIIMIFACECVVIYLFYVYVFEYFQRKDFIEKRKVYENFEAIMKIFDEIIQGVIIFDQKYDIIYSNKTAGSFFNCQQQIRGVSSLERLFSEIHVKSISPSFEVLGTEQILTPMESDSEYQNTLNELLEPIRKVLFHPTSPETSVTAETAWWDTSRQPPLLLQHNKRSFSIKFTTSLFMQKKVVVVNITDTTERDALIAAQASNDYKTRLLSSVSHELRTPLNGSINFIEQTMDDTTISRNTKEKWLIPALRSNRLLLSLVNDILDFSQMHTGKLRLLFEASNIVETARDCIELLEIQASKKILKLQLLNNLSPETETVVTDHNRVRQIILNLLSNAVKFTFEGGITLILDPVSLQLPPTERRETIAPCLKGVRITCRDTGIGMNSENEKKLLHALERMELGTKASINAQGAGLGLLISNHLVQRLCPEDLRASSSKIIKFETKEDVGSSFYFDVYNNEEAKVEHQIRSPEELFRSEGPNVSYDRGMELRNIEELTRDFPLALSSIRGPSRRSIEISFSHRQILASNPTQQLIEMRRSQPPSSSQITCKCPRLLIVDDDPFNLTALDQILRKLKISCHWAFNGKDAIEKIVQRQKTKCCGSCQQYKAMFLDCSMPVMDGFETAKALRQMIKIGEIDDIRIIACTAFVQQADEDKARASGMDDFCTKPIKMAVIRDKLTAVGFMERENN